MPAFSEPTGEEPAFPGTTAESLPSLGGIDKESASLAEHPEVDSCTQGARHEENQGDNVLGPSGGDLGRALSIPEASGEAMSPCELSEPPPQLRAASGSPEFAHTVPALEAMCAGPGDGVAACRPERLEAGDQGACDTAGSLVGAPVGKYLPQEMCSLDVELAGQSKRPDLCPPDDKTLDALSQTRGPEPPQTTCGSNDERTSPDSPLFISTFTWNISQKASNGATGEDLANTEGSASIVKAGQERLSPSHSGDLEERWPLSPESNSSVWAKEGGDENSSPGDIPAGHSSVARFPQEKPTTLIANVECSEVTGANGDTSALSVAPKGHPPKHLAVSVAGHSHAGGPEESSPRAPDGNTSQLPSSVELAHVFNGSTIKFSRELGHMALSGPGIHVRVPQLPEGEGFRSSSPLQTDNLSRKKSQTGHRADMRTLEENFQEKGSETAQSVQQGSSDDNFQETLPTTSVRQVETNLVPSDGSSASSTERGGQSAGTRVSVVAESTMKDDSQPLSQDPPLSNVLLDESKENSPGCWEAGRKLKIITLEASVPETWPVGQLTDSGFKGMDAGLVPDRIRAIPDVLKVRVAMPKLGSSKTASACSPQVEYSSAIANNQKVHKREERAGCRSWSCLSSQYLSQRRFLESSVDPVEGQKVCATGLLPEAFRTRRKEKANHVSQNRDENRLKRDRPAFFKQLLSCPNILESSVDPTDEMSVGWARVEPPEPSGSTMGATGVENKPKGGHLDQRLEVQPAIMQVPCPHRSGETPPSENSTNESQGDRVGWGAGQSRQDGARGDVRSAISPVLGPVQGGEAMPGARIGSQVQEGRQRRSGGPGRSKSNGAALASPAPALSSRLARVTPSSVGVTTHSFTAQSHDLREEDFVEPRNHERAFSDSEERQAVKRGWKRAPPSPGLARGPSTSSPERGATGSSRSHRTEEHEIEEPPAEGAKPTGTPGSPAGPLASVSGERASAKAPKRLPDPHPQGPTLGHGQEPGVEEAGPGAAQASRPPPPAAMKSQEVKEKQKPPGRGHLAEGVKKKILSRVAALRLRLEEKENVRKNSVFESPKPETSVSRTDEKGEPQRPPCQSKARAPVLLKKIQAEMSPDHSGNVKLSCQFAEIHEDSTISWTKDSRLIAQVQRRAGDDSMVSLAILQAGQKDQGLYYCCIKNSYGKVSTEFSLTAEVLKQLSSHPDAKVYEEIEFSQLIFREDFLRDSYFGDRLHGQIATEELHFGEGVHRRAFRSKVLRGLMPLFKPGHACVLKVHNAVAYGTRNNDELVQRNYRLAAQECYVQNTARHYAQIYAAEAQPLEGFGEVPEIIPIFLIHRPENNIPYATVEEELIGEFVKYSIRDGKEINFLRRESEAGQKCCTFQHWVYQKTSGCLLVTDMQGVGMKLTDVGIATEAKGYKGFKGNCSMTFIDQFKALHQCNKYCKMLGLKSLQDNSQKQKKPSIGRSKIQPSTTAVKKAASRSPAEKKS